MRIRYKLIMEGPGPSEAIIEVETTEGSEEVIVDTTILKNGMIEVGAAILQRSGAYLVELPRETSSGRMRAWIKEDNVVKDPIAA